MKKWISENGGILAILAVLIVVLSAYQEWRIGVAVSEALAEQNFPSDATIAEVNGKIGINGTRIDGVQNRQDFTEQQLLDLAAILNRRPE